MAEPPLSEENEDLLEAALARRGGDAPLHEEAEPDPFNPATLLESDEEEESGSEYQKMRGKICHDALTNISGFDLFDEAFGRRPKTMFDCGPGSGPATFLHVIQKYLQPHSTCQILVAKSPANTVELLEHTNFPLHAVILSGLGHTTVKDMKIKLQDIKGLPTNCCDIENVKLREIVSFIHMRQPSLSKLQAAKHLGIKEPAVSFLEPLDKPDVPPQDQVFKIKNLAHEDLMALLQEKTPESFMGDLAWPQVLSALTSIRDRIGYSD